MQNGYHIVCLLPPREWERDLHKKQNASTGQRELFDEKKSKKKMLKSCKLFSTLFGTLNRFHKLI